MTDIESLRREAEGRPAWTPDPGKRPSRKKRERDPRSSRVDLAKSKRPLAGHEASTWGQHWYDLGNQAGFDFPYDANYFALALQAKVDEDPAFKPYLAAGKHDQVDRWVRKMIDTWWDPGAEILAEGGGYLTSEIKPRNAKEYFLGTDWDDLREFAKSSLIAAYLKEHGKRVPQPEYPAQQEYQDRLRELTQRARINHHLERVADAPEPDLQVDEESRQRLKSWREKRSSK